MSEASGPREPGASPAGPPPGEPTAGPAPGRSVCEEDFRRALADLDNLRKRMARDVEQARAEERANAARLWLPVADNLDRALEHAQSDPGSIVAGVRAIRDQVAEILAGLGYPRRDDTGERFDPARHDAVATSPADGVPPGTVVQVVRPGYGTGQHQLRPALVVVSKAD
ncbi:MAG TPA: nucleotide exchange factor GrpE [Streptosporangiaceae bacterium]